MKNMEHAKRKIYVVLFGGYFFKGGLKMISYSIYLLYYLCFILPDIR